jgi:hypothetical protein
LAKGNPKENVKVMYLDPKKIGRAEGMEFGEKFQNSPEDFSYHVLNKWHSAASVASASVPLASQIGVANCVLIRSPQNHLL